MDNEDIRHPYVSANPVSRIFFCWLAPLFKTGYKRPLEFEDMYQLRQQDKTEYLTDNLEKEWNKELQNNNDAKSEPNLRSAIIRLIWKPIFLTSFCVFIEEACRTVQPLFVSLLVVYFAIDSDITSKEAYMYATIIVLLSAIAITITHPYFFYNTLLGMRLRVACSGLIYRKALRLSSTALGRTTVGQVVNILSNDVNRFDQALIFISYIWLAPMQFIVITVLLWYQLGPSSLAGMTIILLITPLQGWFGTLFSKLRNKTAILTDERVRFMNEIISGMQVIKMYSWEKPFTCLVAECRRKEIKKIRETSRLRASNLAFFFVTNSLVSLATFVVYSLTGNTLTASKVYFAIPLFNVVRLSTTLYFPIAIAYATETAVSIRRIQDFLLLKELDPLAIEGQSDEIHTIPPSVEDQSGEIQTNLPAVEDQSGEIQTNSPAVDQDQSGEIKTNLPAVEDQSGEIQTNSPAVDQDQSGEIKTNLPAVEDQSGEIQTNSPAVEDHPGEIQTNSPTIEDQSGEIQTNLPAIKDQSGEIQTNSPAVEDHPGEIQTNLPTIKDQSGEIQTNPPAVEGHPGEIQTNLPAIKDQSGEIQTNLPDVEDQSGEIQTNSPAVEDQSGEIQTNSQIVHVSLENLSASWDEDKTKAMVLKNISFNLKCGELLAVVGPVGCGKSSLLMAIMREIPHITGKLDVTGRFAYASQLPWIFSGTVKENIVFGHPYDKQKFEHAITVCALKKDLDILSNKEETLVGDRGVKLSGGQRARIALARAVYNDKDIYLLDDPLSAVDTQVGRLLFDICIRTSLKDKPCILVTHQLQYLEHVDKILVMKDGEIAGYGTYTELQSSGIDFASLLRKSEAQNDEIIMQKTSFRRGSTINRKLSVVSQCPVEQKDWVKEDDEEEVKVIGNVSHNVYSRFFVAGGSIGFILFYLFLNVAVQTFFNISDWWLSYWVFKEETAYNEFKSMNSTNSTTETSMFEFDSNGYIYILCAVTAVLMVTSFLRSSMTFTLAVNASETLHNKMFYAIVRAPMRFFDANPTGRILNRFSKDVGFMDELLPVTCADIMQISLMVLGSVITVAIFNPIVLIIVLPLAVVFVLARLYFLNTSREIKRMEGITRSPVFSHLSATLQGLSIIRTFQAQNSFIHQFENHQDHHTQAWYLFLTTSRYFGIWLDWMAFFFIATVAFGCLILSNVSDSLNSGTVGLSLSYALSLLAFFQWVVRQTAELENQMTSTERVLEYTDIEPEAPLETDLKPSSDWPKDGRITFEKASLAYYKGGPSVLKEIDCCIHAKEKVGVAGRTGAGKSSLMTALLRLAEPTGKILIDGVVISDLGLHDLRKSISIIPQDPVLFSGSLRRNLDPFGDHTDMELWKALEEVQLKETVSEFHEKLEVQVAEGGTNFSVGQRQLLCLARAVLRQARVLIVDEATANVDIRTDALIQATIREKFKQCTVLTIAHRLNTIMDSDRILILDQGKLAEFDEPFVLLQKKNGFLTKMVAKCGQIEASNLLDIARKKYNEKNSKERDLSTVVNKSIPEQDIQLTM